MKNSVTHETDNRAVSCPSRKNNTFKAGLSFANAGPVTQLSFRHLWRWKRLSLV